MTAALELPLSARRLLVGLFEPEALRELAALMESERPGVRERRSLSEASVDELAEMLPAGKKPTIGWWRRHAS